MRYYSKEHNRLMLSPKVEKPVVYIPETEEEAREAANEQARELPQFSHYGHWLSSSLEIIGEHEYVDGEEVPDSAYEVKKQWLREKANQWLDVDMHLPINYYCKTRLVAIPKKEKEDLEPEASNTDEASVASHSGTVGNSIEHWAKDIEEQADNDYAMMQACEFAEWMNKNVVDYLLDANKFRHEGLEYTAQELYEGPFLHSQWERK
jgi:hypothetical protein